ncbi:hypothetical protein SLA2020_180520 [Shorea laevis]
MFLSLNWQNRSGLEKTFFLILTFSTGIYQEMVRTESNGTEFAIDIRDSPELAASAKVVGEVLEGMEVFVERIRQE